MGVPRLLPATVPDPPRALSFEGRRMWDRIWGLRKPWIDVGMDLDWICLLCETVDERQFLRTPTLRDKDWRDRVALRALDAQIAEMMSALALNPTDRKNLNVGSEPRGKLAELRAARGAN